MSELCHLQRQLDADKVLVTSCAREDGNVDSINTELQKRGSPCVAVH